MALFHLGLSTSGHDPALAIVDSEGQLTYAEATERFVQDKRAWGVAPDHVNHLLDALAHIGFDVGTDTLSVATSWKNVKAELPVEVQSDLLPVTDALWLRELQAGAFARAGASLLRLGASQSMPTVRRYDHHLCHAVTASVFASAQSGACIVLDGEGEVGAVSLFNLRDRRIKRRWRSWGPGSLGTLYAWCTQLCGFDWRLGEEWKVMGLAAYGAVRPEIVDALCALLFVERGKLRFAKPEVLSHLAQDVRRLAPTGARLMDAADFAASSQAAYSRLADQVLSACLDGSDGTLFLSGGCALNSSYNGTIMGRTGFDQIHIPPAPADDGNAVGAAVLSWMETTGCDQIPNFEAMPYLGAAPSISKLARLENMHGIAKVTDLGDQSDLRLASLLAAGKIIGVFRGRAEFGPRALGNRSILADPRQPDMKDRINRLIKGREPYRPFAPVVCEEDVADWFEAPQSSPFMSLTLKWRETRKALVPAVVHEDGTGRLQTVAAATAPWLHRLVQTFGAETGVPIIMNTSLNVMGKPIVHSIEDALAVFTMTGLDALLVEDTLIEKA